MVKMQPDKYKEKHLKFWLLEKVNSPLIGFTVGTGLDSWSYWQDNKAAQLLLKLDEISPENITPSDFVEDQIKYLQYTENIEDDIVRSAMPLASIPWMEAITGCKIISTNSSVSALKMFNHISEVEIMPFSSSNLWAKKYFEFFKVYDEIFKGKYPIGQSIIRGPSDLLCAILGVENAAVSLIDDPDGAKKILNQITENLESFLIAQSYLLPKFLDGYVIGQYELWAPEPVIRIQEDYSNLFSNEMYNEFLQPLDKRLGEITNYTLIHLHSSSLHLIENFLEVNTIRAFQITKDPNVESVDIMINALRKVQEFNKPLVVMGRFTKEDYSVLKNNLKPDGLCIQPVVKNKDEVSELLALLRSWN
ncbi:MAG: hypothetical protein GYA14_06890 [Ignavibacteria bacterium]|nr:hypothetical protein [Ignavibacteria bacterium]